MYFTPYPRIAVEVVYTDAENWIMLDPYQRPLHQVLALLKRTIGRLFRGAVTRQRCEASVQFSSRHHHEHDAG